MAATNARADRPATDRRSQRTRAALFDAFARMVLSEGYDTITPSTLAQTANVGRSTFYEHFANVDEVLAHSVSGILSPLAAAMMKPEMDPATIPILQHFWDNRKIVRGLLVGGGHAVLVRLFTAQFQANLVTLSQARGVRTPLAPAGLAAAHLAAGSLALLGGWVSGQAPGSATQIAKALHAAGYACASSYCAEAEEA